MAYRVILIMLQKRELYLPKMYHSNKTAIISNNNKLVDHSLW